MSLYLCATVGKVNVVLSGGLVSVSGLLVAEVVVFVIDDSVLPVVVGGALQ